MRTLYCFLFLGLCLVLLLPSSSAWRRRRRRRCDSSACQWRWGSCSKSCGGGVQYPVITKPKGSCGSCNLPHHRSCNPQCCRVNCQWGSWSSYGTCSQTCGGGTQSRSRQIKVHSSCGGYSCSQPTTSIRSCNTGCCPTDCQMGPWSPFNKCSKTCGGGSMHRTRVVVKKESCGGGCSQPRVEVKKCGLDCCPVDCRWGSWGIFGQCSASCGGGAQTRKRKPVVVESCGGDKCRGSNIESTSCNSQCCPVDCEWGNWSRFVKCSATCGGGVKHKIRRVKTPASCGGAQCTGESLKARKCNQTPC